jgi:hypothetical protein
MSVRAKFKVETIAPQEADGSVTQITLRAVYGGSPENEKFFKYTPSGQIDLNVVNPTAAKKFVLGQEYYVDFVLAKPIVKQPKPAPQPAPVAPAVEEVAPASEAPKVA